MPKGHNWVSRLLYDMAIGMSRQAPSCTMKGHAFSISRIHNFNSQAIHTLSTFFIINLTVGQPIWNNSDRSFSLFLPRRSKLLPLPPASANQPLPISTFDMYVILCNYLRFIKEKSTNILYDACPIAHSGAFFCFWKIRDCGSHKLSYFLMHAHYEEKFIIAKAVRYTMCLCAHQSTIFVMVL